MSGRTNNKIDKYTNFTSVTALGGYSIESGTPQPGEVLVFNSTVGQFQYGPPPIGNTGPPGPTGLPDRDRQDRLDLRDLLV